MYEVPSPQIQKKKKGSFDSTCHEVGVKFMKCLLRYKRQRSSVTEINYTKPTHTHTL